MPSPVNDVDLSDNIMSDNSIPRYLHHLNGRGFKTVQADIMYISNIEFVQNSLFLFLDKMFLAHTCTYESQVTGSYFFDLQNKFSKCKKNMFLLRIRHIFISIGLYCTP